MILYLAKFKDKDFFDVGVVMDTESITNNTNYDLKVSGYYEGEDSDLQDLTNVIHQLFKKYLVDDTFFDIQHFDKIVEFIEYQANNYGFEISDKKEFNLPIPQNIEKQINSEFKIFGCFVYDEQNISVSLKDSFSDPIFRDEYIDKDRSIVLQFTNEKEARNFFSAIYILTKNINNKLDGKNFTISSENVKQIQGLILNQARSLVGVMEYKMISLSVNKVFDFTSKKSFTSDEVCKLLSIDRQKLAYWRKTGKIKFKKHSDKKFTYQRHHVYDILENMMIENEISPLEEITIKPPKQNPKVNAKLEKLKAASIVEEPKTVSYEDLITEWAQIFTYKVLDHKYDRQKFFLNFGNVGMSSSPQVMINDDYQLVDYIKKKVLKETPAETWEYIKNIKDDGLEPRVDSSKSYYPGYKLLYLNNIREVKKD